MAELAATVGGGRVGPGPASVVSSAALALAASRWLYDQGADKGDPKMLLEASRLADSSRQGLLAAHELTAREARARVEEDDDLASRRAAFQRQLAERQAAEGEPNP